VFQSCLFEENLKFDQSAYERTKAINDNCKKVLTSSPYGWKMAYDSNPISCTRFFLKFKGDSVFIKSDVSTATAVVPDSSLYDFKMSQGPVLSFVTYNDTFHYLSNPNTSNATKGGDYDFTIMKVTDDSIVLKGINGQTHVSLYRAGVDDEANYFTNNTRFKNLLKKTTSSPFFISLLFGDSVGVNMVTELNTRYLTFIYQDATGQTIKDRVAYDYNALGFNIWKEMKTKSKTFSSFIWDATNSNFYPTTDVKAKFIFSHTTPFPYGKTVEKYKGNSYVLTSYSPWFKTNVFTPLITPPGGGTGYDYRGIELYWNKGDSIKGNVVTGDSISFSVIVAPPTGQTYDPNNIYGISGYTTLRDDQVSFQSSGTKTGTNAAKLGNNAYFKNLTNTFFSTAGLTVYEENDYMYLISKENSIKWLCFKLIEK
jgi:hypothetical protein